MLHFLIRKRIDRLMYRGYMAGYNQYKIAVREVLERGGSEDDVNKVRTAYQGTVSDIVSEFIYNFTEPKVVARYELARLSHDLAFPGFPDDQYCVGLEYCTVVYALTGKPGKAKDAVRHNHIFAGYIDKALCEIEETFCR